MSRFGIAFDRAQAAYDNQSPEDYEDYEEECEDGTCCECKTCCKNAKEAYEEDKDWNYT